jgi:diguanylate cyclase (GGDEF)-like protein
LGWNIAGGEVVTPFLHIELNAFAIIILAIMVVNRSGVRSLEQKLFNYALIANALTLVFDALSWVIDGAQFTGSRVLNIASINLYYVMNPLVTFACLIYCDYKIFGSMRRLKARLRLYLVPLVTSYVVFLLNGFTGWFYSFDASNLYVRGPAFLVVPILMVVYPIWIEVLTLQLRGACRMEIERAELKKISRYMILPLLCLGLQIATRGMQLVWIASVISFVMIYINVQNRQIFTDELTGVHNRRQISRAFVRMTEALGASWRLYAVMIDADDFKRVNDSYGHAHGDALLVRTARMLEEICAPSRDFLARMGGDEFLILAVREIGEGLGLVSAIENADALEDRLAESGHALSLSCGVARFGADGIDTLDKLLSAADHAMYRNKAARKRRSDAAHG